jgi:hypothetical protein
MANAVEKLNTIAITDIEKVNTITDANLEDLNTLEFAGAPADAHTLISTHTASASSSLDITSGIDSTYDVYEFHIISMHPATDNVSLTWQANAAGGSGFNETITSTAFRAYLQEDHSGGAVDYRSGEDQGQGTAYELVVDNTGADADQSMAAILRLFAPSSTTYVKHFILEGVSAMSTDGNKHDFRAGYINTTAAIDEISFKFSSGNIDSGVIKMYGIAKS